MTNLCQVPGQLLAYNILGHLHSQILELNQSTKCAIKASSENTRTTKIHLTQNFLVVDFDTVNNIVNII